LAALCRGAATVLLGTTAGAANFSVPYSPTGIAYDALSNRVCVAGNSTVFTYDTNGVQQATFNSGSGTFDLGAGTGGNVWVGNGNLAQSRDYAGNPTGTPSFVLPNNTLLLGRELSVGGTNYVLYGVSGGNVVARELGSTNTVVLLATPAGTTGGDWVLRPGGYALDHVLVGLNTSGSVKIYSKEGTNGFQLAQSISLNTGDYGLGHDCSFGSGVIWVAQDMTGFGYAVSYPFTVAAVPEASVSVGMTNGSAVVSWSGRWLEGSADLQAWSVVSNAPQPWVLSPTNAAQFFRAVK
jgi:hypothetical protein